MQPGDEITYYGDAEHLSSGSQLRIDGRFRVVEPRDDEQGRRFLVEDARLPELTQGSDADPDLHRYLLRVDEQGEPTGAEDRPTG